MPLLVLAVPSILIGLVGTPFANYFGEFISVPESGLSSAIPVAEVFDAKEFYLMAGSSIAISLVGITLAALMYLARKIDPGRSPRKFSHFINYPSTSGTLMSCIIEFL